jgi:hypothetical protein
VLRFRHIAAKRSEKFPFPEELHLFKNSTMIESLRNVPLASQFLQCPSHGTQGRRIAVYANCFEAIVARELELDSIQRRREPCSARKKLRRILQILFEHPEFTGIAADFKSLIISRSPLKIRDGYQTSIAYLAEGDDGPTLNASHFTVRVVPTTTPFPPSSQGQIAISMTLTFRSATSNLSTLSQNHIWTSSY